MNINLRLLSIFFTIFALFASLNPAFLQKTVFLPLQLTLSIPLLLTSIFVRSKFVYAHKSKVWDNYGFITFLISYSFLLNVVGILLTILLGLFYGLTFFLFNTVVALIYSTLEIVDDKNKLVSRIKKDLFFIILLLIGGVIPLLSIV